MDAHHPQPNTIEAATHLAQSFEIPILLYSVQYTPVPIYPEAGVGMGTAPAIRTSYRLEEQGKEALDELCQKIRLRWKKTECEYETGFMAESIVDKSRWLLEKARDIDPMLLILGKEHDYLWWNRIMPTTETKVAEDAPCPVIVMPPEVKFRRFEQITYLLDREELEDDQLPNVRWLTLFGSKFNSTVSFLYLPEKEKMPAGELDQAMARIQALAPYQPQFFKQMDPDAGAEELMEFAAGSPADLVAFPYRERSFFQRLFGNNESRQLILKASVPVMVF